MDSYGLDSAGVLSLDNGFRESGVNGSLWRFKTSVNGKEVLSLNDVPVTAVSDGVKALKFHRADLLRVEATVVDAANKDSVLATNVESVASSNATNKAIWDNQCKGQVATELKLSDADFKAAGETNAKVKLNMCDFVGFTLKPTVTIEPQVALREKKTTIYHCALVPTVLDSEVKTYGSSPCPYGYDMESGETAPVNTILKKFAPSSPLYDANILTIRNFILSTSRAGQLHIDGDFGAMAFGSQAGCHTQKVEVRYADNAGFKIARLTFKRVTDDAGNVIWAPQDAATWPSFAQVHDYYVGATQEKIHVYRFCDWIPEAEDVASGSVIEFSAN